MKNQILAIIFVTLFILTSSVSIQGTKEIKNQSSIIDGFYIRMSGYDEWNLFGRDFEIAFENYNDYETYFNLRVEDFNVETQGFVILARTEFDNEVVERLSPNYGVYFYPFWFMYGFGFARVTANASVDGFGTYPLSADINFMGGFMSIAGTHHTVEIE